MKKFFDWAWANKQAITGAVTASLSGLATADILSAELVVKITALTGVLMTGFALVYSYFKQAQPLPPPASETARITQ
jgi:hypothetical protein